MLCWMSRFCLIFPIRLHTPLSILESDQGNVILAEEELCGLLSAQIIPAVAVDLPGGGEKLLALD